MTSSRVPGCTPGSPTTTRNARASHTCVNPTFLRRIFRCVLYADFNRPLMSTLKPGANASSCSDRNVVSLHSLSASKEASRLAPPICASATPRAAASEPRPATVAAVAASADRVAAAAAAADFTLRSLARSTSKGGTHCNNAFNSSCSLVVGFALRARSSSSAATLACSAMTLDLSCSAIRRRSPRPAMRKSLGVPAFSPRLILSKNICKSAPVGGSHVQGPSCAALSFLFLSLSST
mmetsp:Transcript_12612/g.41919  ORF Transcript_12612/g.41919 Transcript_12612/m.41919 type:complete len:237 (-) Transcript_12612:1632-2342(-)